MHRYRFDVYACICPAAGKTLEIGERESGQTSAWLLVTEMYIEIDVRIQKRERERNGENGEKEGDTMVLFPEERTETVATTVNGNGRGWEMAWTICSGGGISKQSFSSSIG